MTHNAYVIAIALAGVAGITLGLAPSVIARIRNRRAR